MRSFLYVIKEGISAAWRLNTEGADKSLVRSGRKQARKYVKDARAISTTSRRELSSILFSLLGKAPKVFHANLTETLACFLPGRAKDLSAPLKRNYTPYSSFFSAFSTKSCQFLIWNFRLFLNAVCFVLGNPPASEFNIPTFRNTLSLPSSYAGWSEEDYLPKKMEQEVVPKRRHIKYIRRIITETKAYKKVANTYLV